MSTGVFYFLATGNSSELNMGCSVTISLLASLRVDGHPGKGLLGHTMVLRLRDLSTGFCDDFTDLHSPRREHSALFSHILTYTVNTCPFENHHSNWNKLASHYVEFMATGHLQITMGVSTDVTE